MRIDPDDEGQIEDSLYANEMNLIACKNISASITVGFWYLYLS